MKKKKGSHRPPNAYRLHNWSAIVSKLCIACSVKIWRYRCEMIQINKEGNVDDILRSKLLAYSLSLQDTPWLLRSRDRHLVKRKMKFFLQSKRVTLLSWKNRLDVALKLAEKNVSEVGGDLTYYFGKTQLKEVSSGAPDQTDGKTHVQRETSYESKVKNRHKKNIIGVNSLCKIQSSSLH